MKHNNYHIKYQKYWPSNITNQVDYVSAYSIKNLAHFITIIFLFLTTYTAHAACIGKTTTIKPPAISINANSVALYGTIGSEVNTGSVEITNGCNTGDPYTTVDLLVPQIKITTIDNRSIYPTSSPGIGYAYAFQPSNFCYGGIKKVWSASSTSDRICTFVGTSNTTQGTFYLQFYKIGNITSTADLSLSGNPGISSYPTATNPTLTKSPLQMSNINVSISSCTLQSSNNSFISLPNVDSNMLLKNGGLGGNTPFNITVNCPSAMKVAMTFTDNNNIGQTSNILTNTSTAKGVGIQLSYNGNIISFGPDSADPGTINQILLNNNLTGSQTFQFNAAYIRTGTITPGSVAAKATFTLSYQ
jgi:type 1 fimbria pilin